jgi:hypothetical protein
MQCVSKVKTISIFMCDKLKLLKNKMGSQLYS